jgi:hypothetical protein
MLGAEVVAQLVRHDERRMVVPKERELIDTPVSTSHTVRT